MSPLLHPLSLCLLLPLAREEGPAQPTKHFEVQPSKPLDLQPGHASQRIKHRNLFHPLRGVLPEGAPGAVVPPVNWPVLVGTTVAGKDRFAMLRWATGAVAVSVGKGEAHEGYEVITIEQDRVQMKHLPSQETNWIVFQQSEEGKAAEVSEYQILAGQTKSLAPTKAAPVVGSTK